MKRTTTSIKIDPELWKKAKIYCIKKGIGVSEFLEILIREHIKKVKK
jgi:hypothetical protein